MTPALVPRRPSSRRRTRSSSRYRHPHPHPHPRLPTPHILRLTQQQPRPITPHHPLRLDQRRRLAPHPHAATARPGCIGIDDFGAKPVRVPVQNELDRLAARLLAGGVVVAALAVAAAALFGVRVGVMG